MGDKPKLTILCVDDEPDIVSSLYDTFMDTYTVVTANGGGEALKIFNEKDIALVITDQRMPEMEGTELLASINEAKPACKKILLTGYADINAAVDAINMGSVDKYFSKPWDDEELAKAVKDLLALYSIDEFLARVVEDGKSLKEKVVQAKDSSERFEKFLDTYLMGVCMVVDGDKIEYMNITGLELLNYKDMAEITGRDFKDIFLLNATIQKEFYESYTKKDLTPDKLDVKLGDGTSARMRANILFADGMQVSGIVFNKS